MNQTAALILKHTKLLIFFLGENYEVLNCSDSVHKILGMKPSELAQKSFWPYIHPNDKVRLEQLITSQSFSENNSPCERIRFMHSTKGEVWLDTCTTYIGAENGPKYMLAGMPIVDLSEQEKNAIEKEAALNDSEEIGKMGSWWVNIETRKNHWSTGNFILWNQEEKTDPPPIDWVLSQLHEEDAESIQRAIKYVGRTGKPMNLTFRVKDKIREKTFLTRIRPWYVDGKLQEVKGVNIDITDIIKAQNELENKNQELEEKNKRLSEYAFMNSHQIRGPLSNILGIGELIKADELSIHEVLELIEKAGNQLDGAIRKANEILTTEN